ncbi:MAG TPA: aldehyde ferredoxin oxidoreductase family protein [Dehalococcoidia bacterium]|nr:aldehyde ferredoxin oxidoreductase family protein [Dehalococcoidia bacterium]
MAGGYMGKVLFVNLTNGTLRDEPLDDGLRRDFIGGYGLGARILFSQQKANVDPLGADSIAGFLTGPLTGTPALSGSRYVVVGKSPLTGGWGDANSGGYFGPQLKFAGYDGVFFTGISEKPVYVYLNEGKAELRDASNLWGKDTFETEDTLKSEHGQNIEIACIGPAGEGISLISAVMNNKGRAAGRSGVGAIMGSKKLKAIVASGQMNVPLADETRAKELRTKYMAELLPVAQMFRAMGTSALTAASAHSGDSPVKNWGGVGVVDFPNVDPIAAAAIMERQEKKYACWHCPIGCGGHMKEGTGEYKYEAGAHKPEYETLCMFGSNCLNNNVESIIKVNDICNRYGLDTISTGATVAFAIECYENGIISKSDTDGIEMTWGNHQSIVAMTEKIAKREGFGEILADGVRVASSKIGNDSDLYAIHIQGQELPAHDPKLGYHYATTYRMDATPGRHTQGSEGLAPPDLLPKFDRKSYSGRAEAHRIGSNFNHVMNAAGLCMFMYISLPSASVLTDFMSAVTGWDVTTEELIKTGERIANIRHSFNLREGLNPIEFKVPDRSLGEPAQKEGPVAGVTVDESTMVQEYLKAMDWDSKSARPSKEKLLELGLADVAGELWP